MMDRTKLNLEMKKMKLLEEMLTPKAMIPKLKQILKQKMSLANDNALSRVRRRVDVDSILEDISQPGHPTTRSRTRLANFCGSFSFLSMLEPSKFDEAMQDPDWMVAMMEELHQFEKHSLVSC